MVNKISWVERLHRRLSDNLTCISGINADTGHSIFFATDASEADKALAAAIKTAYDTMMVTGNADGFSVTASCSDGAIVSDTEIGYRVWLSSAESISIEGEGTIPVASGSAELSFTAEVPGWYTVEFIRIGTNYETGSVDVEVML